MLIKLIFPNLIRYCIGKSSYMKTLIIIIFFFPKKKLNLKERIMLEYKLNKDLFFTRRRKDDLQTK